MTALRAVGLIPARYASTRFPGKVLAPIAGRPMIQHVVERARQAKLLDLVLVATDDARVRDAVAAFGGRAVMTSPDHASGTDRIAEVARGIDCGIVVNVQGDEPTLDPASIDGAVAPLLDHPTVEMATLCTPLRDEAAARDPNTVKVVCDRRGFALYFSRACIPYYREAPAGPVLWRKHIGLYAYRREVLLRLGALAPTALEVAERLEQLRALEHGIRIVVVETEHDAIGVDVPADIARVAALLAGPASMVHGPAS